MLNTEDDRKREEINRWYDRHVHQRLDEKAKGVVIVVMQRLHENDLSGYLLQQNNWVHMCLPAIAVKDECYSRVFGKKIVRKKGEALNPSLEDRNQLRRSMLEMGPVTFMAQYQQNPVAPGDDGGYHGTITVTNDDPNIEPWQRQYFFGSVPAEIVVLDKVFCEPCGLEQGHPGSPTGDQWEEIYGKLDSITPEIQAKRDYLTKVIRGKKLPVFPSLEALIAGETVQMANV